MESFENREWRGTVFEGMVVHVMMTRLEPFENNVQLVRKSI